MSYVGASIGAIRIEARLGKGGMGEVYLGYDPRLERRVAVKTIRAEKRLTPQVKARFLREARLLSKLGHPSICQVYDLVETPEADFLILELVQGTTLRQLTERGGLSFERKLALARKIAAALAVAHREKIVHRDLKADNIMVTPEGEVKVLDFGIARSLSEELEILPPPPLPDLPAEAGEGETQALGPSGPGWSTERVEVDLATRLTRLGMVVGTVQAMSPEQASGGRVAEPSDLYSFGILLHELFTEQPAYDGTEQSELMRRVVRAETGPIEGLDPDLTRLIQDLESFDPRRRPTAAEAAERLRWIEEKPQRLRRQRLRWRAVAAAFVLLLGVLGVVSWLAVRAERVRREADQRRKQAEALIGFMLGDLREKLRAVNRLDVLDAVGDRALDYFGAVPESQLTDEELARRVDALVHIGEVRYLQGNLPAAMAVFRRTEALGRGLVARDPANEDWQAGYGDTESWIGQIFFDQGRPDEALPLWREAVRLNEEQLRLHPGSSRWTQAAAVSYHNLGTVMQARGDLDGAVRQYRTSLALDRRLEARKPGDPDVQSQIAGTLAYVSDVLERQGDLAGALAERRTYLEIQERLAAGNPGDANRRFDAAVARGFVAGLLAVRGDRVAARGLYEKGLAEVADLAAHDPGNAVWQRWLGTFRSALGALAVADGDPRGALVPLGEARRVLEPLVAQDPTNSDWRRQLGVARSRTAAALAALDPARARTEARAALEILEPLLQSPPDEATRGLLAEAEVTCGQIEEALGSPAGARAAWERALADLAPAPKPLTHWKLLAPAASALLGLDRLDEARPALDRLAAMGYRNPDLAALCRTKGLPQAGEL